MKTKNLTITFRLWMAVVVSLVFAVSCSQQKLIQKKLKKAEGVVLANDSLFNKIGKKWEATNPCVNDTVTSVEHDTLAYPVYRDVPVLIKGLPDTSFKMNGVSITIKNGLITADCIEPKIVVKTKTNTVVDIRRLGLARDSISMYESQLNDALLMLREARDSYRQIGELLIKEGKNASKKLFARTLLLGIPIIGLLLLLAYLYNRKPKK